MGTTVVLSTASKMGPDFSRPFRTGEDGRLLESRKGVSGTCELVCFFFIHRIGQQAAFDVDTVQPTSMAVFQHHSC